MSGPQKHTAIIIDSEMQKKMMLKQATNSVNAFGNVMMCGSLEEGRHVINNGQLYDVIFVASRFDRNAISSFIKECKATKGAQDAAYILVLTSKSQDNSQVAANMMTGADGFLFEPYSVDQLEEITILSTKVKKERSVAREKVALKLVVDDIIKQFDKISYLRSKQIDSGAAEKKFKAMFEFFKTLSPEAIDYYYEIAIPAFEEAKIPVIELGVKNYAGVSKRIKKKTDEKIAKKLEAAT